MINKLLKSYKGNIGLQDLIKIKQCISRKWSSLYLRKRWRDLMTCMMSFGHLFLIIFWRTALRLHSISFCNIFTTTRICMKIVFKVMIYLLKRDVPKQWINLIFNWFAKTVVLRQTRKIFLWTGSGQLW